MRKIPKNKADSALRHVLVFRDSVGIFAGFVAGLPRNGMDRTAGDGVVYEFLVIFVTVAHGRETVAVEIEIFPARYGNANGASNTEAVYVGFFEESLEGIQFCRVDVHKRIAE